jgi:hypothetical protein
VIPATDIQTVAEATTDEISRVRETAPEIPIEPEMLLNSVEVPDPEQVPAPVPVVAEEIDYDYEPEPPAPKRRTYWLIPLALAVIVILGGVFYLRNCRQEPVGSRQSAVGGQESAVSSQESAVGGQESAVGGQQSEVDSMVETQPAKGSIKTITPTTQNSELQTQNSELKTQNSTLITSGVHLFQISRDVYDGNPYLWALIYKANRDVIANPQNLPKGLELVIPGLEGTPHKLSHNDSLEVSEGYRLLSEYYREKDAALSEELLKTSVQYSPK